jgi:hypothetical protein
MDYSVILTVSAFATALISIVLLFTNGFIPALMVLGVAAFILYLLHIFGKFDIKTTPTGIDFDFHENAPSGKNSSYTTTPHIKEVFHITDTYTYEEAPAVCAAMGADLASFDQLTEAFSLGAEWCSYGWSAGGMALYPTQESTWSQLQQEVQEVKRTACGRPGVNGGYFDPKLKFGVNCYGIKPRNKGMKFPQPLSTDSGFNEMVNKFKKMTMNLTGFNRDIWSEANIPGEIKKNVSNTALSLEKDIESIPSTLYNAL